MTWKFGKILKKIVKGTETKKDNEEDVCYYCGHEIYPHESSVMKFTKGGVKHLHLDCAYLSKHR